jgi:TetR/AcrR family transcriptional repressor of nem operon
MSRQNDKRSRLVDAANDLIYEQTFNATTLADIAAKASVPLGNVYYYFKTKDDILKAVVQKKSIALQALFAEWETIPSPKDRILAFIQHAINQAEITARFGCDMGSLCQELGKNAGELSQLSAELMHRTLEWTTSQFKALGKNPETADALAKYLVSSLQGVSLLTLTFKDPALLVRESKTLEYWLEKYALAA